METQKLKTVYSCILLDNYWQRYQVLRDVNPRPP